MVGAGTKIPAEEDGCGAMAGAGVVAATGTAGVVSRVIVCGTGGQTATGVWAGARCGLGWDAIVAAGTVGLVCGADGAGAGAAAATGCAVGAAGAPDAPAASGVGLDPGVPPKRTSGSRSLNWGTCPCSVWYAINPARQPARTVRLARARKTLRGGRRSIHAWRRSRGESSGSSSA